ncbi:MAG TPA: hypothetical protein VFB12_07210 [Ktedonobacteraceae bacterium]|nr:hypothetical protein [Ktedonobacteraceae bacterium]
MTFFTRSMVSKKLSLVALVPLIIGLTGVLSSSVTHAASLPRTNSKPIHIDCSNGRFLCTEVMDTERVFGQGHYVGHDEPATLFYSNQSGSGNRTSWNITLPSDPAPAPLSSGKAFNFQLHIAFWLGMAMCDTQSYPEQVSTCTPDSDQNIVDPAVSPKHPGTAFSELQFYPPGWVRWPAGTSCDATRWCAALNIDSLSLNPVTGQPNNAACINTVGIEPVNFAFITKNGRVQAPANPVDATTATYTPDPQSDLFMNSGDRVTVTMQDTPHGLLATLVDWTSGQSGFMLASAANSFGQVKFDPSGTTCQSIPYDFHPMYSTSSEKTRVPWAAHSYNIAFVDEIGHFDYCNGPVPIAPGGSCPDGNLEGVQGDQEPADSDDTSCYPAYTSLLVPVSGCLNSNTGFDGISYQPLWPDGNTSLHPTPVRFSSPLTGASFNVNYNRVAFEADLPRIEGTCDRVTGTGCTLVPINDDGVPAAFYPFFSIQNVQNQGCSWRFGNHMPDSINDFGQNGQYNMLLPLAYTGPEGKPFTVFNDFRRILSTNPCEATPA